jgi:hypothetical protein
LGLAFAVATSFACSKGLSVSRRDGGTDASARLAGDAKPDADRTADAAPDSAIALPPDGGDDASDTVTAVPPDGGGDAGILDTGAATAEVASDSNALLWPGPDATIVLDGGPVTPDGGIYPQVYAFPGIALASHSKMFAAEPDLTFTVQEIGNYQYADLNSDGLGDIVIANGSSLAFYLQQASGAFQPMPGITLSANDSCERYVFADFNHDGLLDLAMVHHPGPVRYLQGIAIFLQSAQGFRDTPDQELANVLESNVTCNHTYYLGASDMNDDGRADLIALSEMEYDLDPGSECGFSKSVAQVFLQDGTGTFALSASFSPRSSDATCGACGTSLAGGDFNGDGRGDLAVIQDGHLSSSDADYPGHQVITYPQTDDGFSATPTQVLNLGQYLKTVSLVDVNGDGKLDILARSADWGLYGPDIGAAGVTPGLSGVFLQKADGSFDEAKTITPDGWLPAGTDPKKDPIGIDVRDLDLDGVKDLVLERRSAAEGLFRQERGLFAATPDAEIQSVPVDWVRAAKQSVSVTYAIDKGTATTTGQFNHLAYALADMNGDGRPDVVAAYQPFAPAVAPDPATGVYPSYPGPQTNTYTQFRVYLQRPLTSRFVVEIQESRVSVEDKVLRIRATVHNLAKLPANNVHVRVLAAPTPFLLQTTLPILASGPDGMAEFGANWVKQEENAVRGDPLGPDIVIPRIEADETTPLALDVPVALVADLDVRCLFVSVEPDRNTNVILRRKYDFIAPN